MQSLAALSGANMNDVPSVKIPKHSLLVKIHYMSHKEFSKHMDAVWVNSKPGEVHVPRAYKLIVVGFGSSLELNRNFEEPLPLTLHLIKEDGTPQGCLLLPTIHSASEVRMAITPTPNNPGRFPLHSEITTAAAPPMLKIVDQIFINTPI